MMGGRLEPGASVMGAPERCGAPPPALAAAQGLAAPTELGPFSLMTAGGLAGIAYWALVFPLDTLKTRIQTDSPHKPAYSGMLDCARKVVRAEGLAGLFKGWQPCFARAVPAKPF